MAFLINQHTTVAVPPGGDYYAPPTSDIIDDFDFGQASTITLNSGAVSQINNNSGGIGTALSQATGTRQPLLVAAGLNGWDYAQFDGSNDWIRSSTYMLSAPVTVYVVVRMKTWANNRYIFDGRGANVSQSLAMINTTPQLAIASANAHGTNRNSNLAVNTWGIVRCVFNSGSSEIRVNLTSAVSVTLGSSAISGLTIGEAYNVNDGNAGHFDLARIIRYSVAHDSTTGETIINGLAGQYGISV